VFSERAVFRDRGVGQAPVPARILNDGRPQRGKEFAEHAPRSRNGPTMQSRHSPSLQKTVREWGREWGTLPIFFKMQSSTNETG
jgi:hypothetical protein